jgi:hypothetical protein
MIVGTDAMEALEEAAAEQDKPAKKGRRGGTEQAGRSKQA